MLSLKETLSRVFGRPATPSRIRREPPKRRLRLEWLEERTLLCNPGDLDLTFGTGGKVVTSINSGSYPGEIATAIALQSDGKSVVGGWSYNGTDYDMAVVRYNVDGSLDTSFSGDGIQTVAIGTQTNEKGWGIAIQSDGKIVVAGTTSSSTGSNQSDDFALVRLNSNGSLDTSFGSGGKVVTNFNGTKKTSSSDNGWAVAIQADGKIVVAGSSGTSDVDFALARYTASGVLDSSFGSGGKVTTHVTAGTDTVRSVVIVSGGKILVGGIVNANTGADNSDIALARYNSTGSLDTTFGVGGITTTDFAGGNDGVRSIAIQSDGKIVASGSATLATADFAIVRYNANGSLDTTFGSGGKLTLDFGQSESAKGVAIQSDGKIVAAGGGSSAFELARLNSDGTLDSTFGTSGVVTTDFGRDPEGAHAVVIQSDGSILTAGGIGGSGVAEADFAQTRYCA